MREAIETFTFDMGYDGSRTSIEADHRHLGPGSLNHIITGNGKVQAFKNNTLRTGEGSLYLTEAGNGFGGLGSYDDTDVKGSIFRILSALFFIGNGKLRYNGVAIGGAAQSSLQLKLLESGVWSAVTYQAGLDIPLAPTLAVLPQPIGGDMTGKLKNGTFSAKVCRIRASTGVRSLASPQSNIIVVEGAPTEGGSGKTARITFPSIGLNGADRWGIYVSPRSFGSTGPHYFLQEVSEDEVAGSTIDGVPRSIEIEWSDGALIGGELAPIDSYVPPSGVFAGVLGDTVFIDGCFANVNEVDVDTGSPGSTIVISLPLRPEEFPPDWALYPPEPPTALLRGGDGFFYRFGKSSMGVISNVGGEPALAYQEMWPTTGISYPHNAVVGTGGRVYAKNGENLVRIGAEGEPETAWAAPVADQMKDLDDAKTVLGWDTNSHSLVIMNENTVLVYNEQANAWGSPCTIDPGGDVTAAVTDGNELIIAARQPSGINLYNFNNGTGSEMVAMTDWRYAVADSDAVRQIDIVMRADALNTVTLDIFANEDNSAPVLTTTLPVKRTGTVKLPSERLLLPDLDSFAIRLTQQTVGGDAGFEAVRCTGYSRRL